MTSALTQVREATSLLAAAARAVDGVGATDAVSLARAFAAAGKVAQAGAFRAARAAGDDGARRVAGEKSAASLLSSAAGTTVGKARAGLAVAAQAAAVPILDQALRDGEVSIEQASVIAPALARAPGDAEDLVATAKRASMPELREAAARSRARALGEAGVGAHERALHERRYCRTSVQPDGGVRIDAFLGSLDGAAVLAALARETDRLWHEAVDAGVEPSFDHLRADAFVALVRGNPGGAGPAEVLVRVDASALVRGATEGDEMCEIAGVGPVSVATARSLLGEGLLTLLVQDGADITTVTSTTRTVPRRVAQALHMRDPRCVVPGCGASMRLEIDHWRLDFSRHGLTALDNLCRLCALHHRMKTRTGWQLLGGPGKWRWLPPRGPDRRSRPLRQPGPGGSSGRPSAGRRPGAR